MDKPGTTDGSVVKEWGEVVQSIWAASHSTDYCKDYFQSREHPDKNQRLSVVARSPSVERTDSAVNAPTCFLAGIPADNKSTKY